MNQLKWRIKNQAGLYVTVPDNEQGTVLMSNDIPMSTVFGPYTKDYMDGYCKGLTACLDDKFIAVPATHFEYPKTPKECYEKMDDIHAGK